MDKELDEKHKILDFIKQKDFDKDNLIAVFEYYQKTNDADVFESLILANDGLVKHMLGKYREYADYEDIEQEGRIGLITAIKKYDPHKGYAFSTFASHYILGYAMRYISGNNAIHVPYNIITEMGTVSRFREKNPNATDEEVALGVNLSLDTLQEYDKYKSMLSVKSLNEKISDDNNESLLSYNIKDDAPGPDECVDRQETRRIILNEIEKVATNDKKKYILLNVFCGDAISRKQRVIAKNIGSSTQYVSNVVTEAIRKLREPHRKQKIKAQLALPLDVRDLDVVEHVFK